MNQHFPMNYWPKYIQILGQEVFLSFPLVSGATKHIQKTFEFTLLSSLTTSVYTNPYDRLASVGVLTK